MPSNHPMHGAVRLLSFTVAALVMPWAAQGEPAQECTLPAQAIVADSAATLYLAIGVHSQVKHGGGDLLESEILAPYFADGRLGLNAHDEPVTRHPTSGPLAVITDDIGAQYTVLDAQLVCK